MDDAAAVKPDADQPQNGNGEPKVARCESCNATMPTDFAPVQTKGHLAGKRAHLVRLHPGRPSAMRPCGPVYVAWFYWLAYVVTFPGQPERTRGGTVSFDAPITQPAQLASAITALQEAEAKKLKAVDRQTGAALMGAPLPEVEITGWQLVVAV